MLLPNSLIEEPYFEDFEQIYKSHDLATNRTIIATNRTIQFVMIFCAKKCFFLGNLVCLLDSKPTTPLQVRLQSGQIHRVAIRAWSVAFVLEDRLKSWRGERFPGTICEHISCRACASTYVDFQTSIPFVYSASSVEASNTICRSMEFQTQVPSKVNDFQILYDLAVDRIFHPNSLCAMFHASTELFSRPRCIPPKLKRRKRLRSQSWWELYLLHVPRKTCNCMRKQPKSKHLTHGEKLRETRWLAVSQPALST